MDPLWAELINSDWQDYRGSGEREDRLGNDVWLGRFLARTGWQGERLPGAGERERLRRLRAILRRMVDAIRARRQVGRDDLAQLNRILAGEAWLRQLGRRSGAWQLSTVASGRGIGRVETEVALSFASLLAEGDPTRVKICANPDCGWVMVDESRNRTRQWCEASECGNLIKVRRFRQRRRALAGRS